MSAYKKITHDIAAVASGDLITSAVGIDLNGKYVIDNALIKGNYLFINIFAKPSSGTMTPKLRIYSYDDTFISSSLTSAKWAQGNLITPKDADGNSIAISDTTNGQTLQLSPILIGSKKVAVILESCETGGQLVISVERASGGLL